MPSKFFRVATEGATTDGREIQRSWIEQMAKNFNREKYGARVWLEHYRGTVPGGAFDALGDVISVKPAPWKTASWHCSRRLKHCPRWWP